MSNPIFDLEQQILDCWKVTNDIEMVTRHLIDHTDGYSDDDVMNKYLAIKDLYEVKFEAMWRTFEAALQIEAVCKEYHGKRNLDLT